MENLNVRSCKLCLKAINGKNYEVIEDVTKEILRVFLLDFGNDSECVMCSACLSKLYAALKFKSTCLDSDDTIFPYVDNAVVLPIDLKEIYMKERGSKSILDGDRICRLCLVPIKNVSELKPINEEQVGMVKEIVPEMEQLMTGGGPPIKSTDDPVIDFVDAAAPNLDVEVKCSFDSTAMYEAKNVISASTSTTPSEADFDFDNFNPKDFL